MKTGTRKNPNGSMLSKKYALDCIFPQGYVSDSRFSTVTERSAVPMEQTSGEGQTPSKADRLAEIFRRMSAAPACSTFDKAYELLCKTIDEVEDELTDYPNEPDRWMQLQRLFPPQMDRMSSVQGCDLKRFDNRRHVTYIASNGAMEVRSLRVVDGEVCIHFTKAGSDGQSVCDVCPDLKDANL
ncbi:MAG: hypothetical protein R3C18_23450 [Planctomycetaceae bacterium]